MAIYGAIPWSTIERYARRAGLDEPDAFEAFAHLLREMDVEWRTWMHRKDR